jgi:hypothetical protein
VVVRVLGRDVEGMTASELRRAAASRDCQYLDDALDTLLTAGTILAEEIPGQEPGTRYRLSQAGPGR